MIQMKCSGTNGMQKSTPEKKKNKFNYVAIRLYNIYLKKKKKKKKQKNETVKRDGLSSLEIMHIRVRLTRTNGCTVESTRLFITFYERTRLSRLFCMP